METTGIKNVSLVLSSSKMTKKRILQGAEELFFSHGIKSITMDDIAQHLGMSKKTIYSSFRDKDEIVLLMMKGKLEEDKKEISAICGKCANIVEEVFGIMKHISSMFSKLNPVVFYDLQKYHPEAWKLFKAFKNDFMLKLVEENIERGIRQGHVRSDVNVRIMARMRIEQVEMAFNPFIFPPDKVSILEVQIAMIEHFLYGICTLKGHKLINKYKQIVEED